LSGRSLELEINIWIEDVKRSDTNINSGKIGKLSQLLFFEVDHFLLVISIVFKEGNTYDEDLIILSPF
jgi:hypothetical protein